MIPFPHSGKFVAEGVAWDLSCSCVTSAVHMLLDASLSRGCRNISSDNLMPLYFPDTPSWLSRPSRTLENRRCFSPRTPAHSAKCSNIWSVSCVSLPCRTTHEEYLPSPSHQHFSRLFARSCADLLRSSVPRYWTARSRAEG